MFQISIDNLILIDHHIIILTRGSTDYNPPYFKIKSNMQLSQKLSFALPLSHIINDECINILLFYF